MPRVLNHIRCVPDTHRFPQYRVSRSVQRRAKAAPTIDLTTPTLAPPFEPAWNQANEGSCGPHTAGEGLALDAERNEGVVLTQRPSPRFIYFVTRQLMGTLHQDSGVDNDTMMKALAKYGWCDESQFPYSDNPSLLAVPPSAAAVQQAATRKVTNTHLVQQGIAPIQGCLANGDPLVFSFSVPASFMGNDVAATGIMPMPKAGESIVGGHDTLLCGFTLVDMPGVKPGLKWPANTAKCKNHWYEGSVPWGDNGYFYVPLAFLIDPHWAGDAGYYWTLANSGLPAPQPSPTPTPNPAPIVVPGIGVDFPAQARDIVSAGLYLKS